MSSDLNKKYTSILERQQKIISSQSSDLFNKVRENALLEFQKNGIPTVRNENYKYTNLLPLFNFDWEIPEHTQNISINLRDIFQCDVPDLDTHVVLTVNGSYFGLQQKSDKLPENIIIDSIDNVAKNRPELIKDYLFKQQLKNKDGLSYMNEALSHDGYFIYIPKNANLPKPIQIVNILIGDEQLMTHQRNLIIADENSESKIVICEHTLNNKKYISNNTTEIFVKPGAHFETYAIQNQHNNSYSIDTSLTEVHKDASFHSTTISLHGGLIRNNIQVSLVGQGAFADVSGLALADREQHIDNNVFIDHLAPNCESNQFFKNILDDKATTAFTGRILVREDSQKTNAYQSNKNLLLTDEATANSRPQLEIYADDVKCSHGSATGQLDKDAIFYLKARGINSHEAGLLMMYAFAHEIIGKIKVPALAERIEDLIDKRLRGELSRCNSCNICN